MTQPTTFSPPDAPEPPVRLTGLFVAIVAVEALTIAALGWFGRHFS